MLKLRKNLGLKNLPRAEKLRQARLNPQVAERFAAGAKVLADPTRLTLAVALRDGGELCVCDLSWIAERAENLVSHHVRALRAAGLVRSRREGKMVMYDLTDRGRALVDAVLADEVSVSARSRAGCRSRKSIRRKGRVSERG